MSWWSERMLEWAMSHPSFKTQLFRFVDVFPATTDDADVLRHLDEYFEGTDAPRLLDLGVGRGRPRARRRARCRRRSPAATSPAWPSSSSWATTAGRRGGRACTGCGERAAPSPSTCWARRPSPRPRPTATRRGSTSCSTRCSTPPPRWAPDDHLERDDLGPLPRVNVSIKPTALASLYSPLTRDDGLAQAKARLRPHPAAGGRPRRVRVLRHGALRRQGPHAASCSASC